MWQGKEKELPAKGVGCVGEGCSAEERKVAVLEGGEKDF